MNAIYLFFALWSLPFWIALIFLSILAIAFQECEKPWRLFFTIGLAVFLFGPNVFPHFTIGQLLGYFGGYLVIGASWSVFKWWKFVQGKMKEARAGKKVNSYEIEPSRNKSKITGWIACWPLSVFWTLFHDIFEWIYDGLVGIYLKISSKAQDELKALEAIELEKKK